MDNLGKLEIARQRKRVCAGHTPRISDVKALLDALEASNAREAEKDATIFRLTAERDAEKRRADAAEDFNRRLRGIVREKMCVGCAWESGGKICRQVTYSQCRLINEIRDAQEEMP